MDEKELRLRYDNAINHYNTIVDLLIFDVTVLGIIGTLIIYKKGIKMFLILGLVGLIILTVLLLYMLSIYTELRNKYFEDLIILYNSTKWEKKQSNNYKKK